ncbi:hypothetical protein LSTR_LSTR013785 [Laodelphax striatellus]|uniref:Tetratricopeptide repeat protein 21A/21B N-terminal ARM repeat domain-containing protein n=1 Tax=Laodelphax striatellus TaxID=195883 RepID=A0A482XHD2_LAOST|nr:hypothetical protein LSTR_LSTR013785 [Laodelphax striatellus]
MESIWIRYWGLEKQYGCMVIAAKSALERNPTNSQLNLLYGTSLALFGKNSEAISNLESLLNDPQLVFPASLALVYAHNSCEIINREAVAQLDAKLKEEVRKASEASLSNAAWFYLLTGRPEQASDCADRMLLNNPKSCAVAILKGWIDFVRGKKPSAAEHFKQAASQEKQNTEAVLGEAMSLPMQEGMTRLNQLIVRFPKVAVPLMEKAKLQLAIKDWTQTLDTASRVLSLDANNFYAVKVQFIDLQSD